MTKLSLLVFRTLKDDILGGTPRESRSTSREAPAIALIPNVNWIRRRTLVRATSADAG